MIPSQQYKIFGHEKILTELINLFENNILPNKILLSGKKSIGKSTLAFHFINYVFSRTEEHKYNISKCTIHPSNKSNILVNNNTHPSLFRIFLKDDKKSIEISDVRNLINFTNLSNLSNQKKIILIDDVEYLNVNAVNALLKVIEEPNSNTIFILINNIEKRIKDTLRSRCIEFKLSINKLSIKKIINNLYPDIYYDEISSDFVNYSQSLGNLINFITICKNENLDFKNITIENFLKHIFANSVYKKKEYQKIDFKIFIEIFFRKKINYINCEKIFYLYSYFNLKFDKCKKFNLDIETFFLEFKSKLLND